MSRALRHPGRIARSSSSSRRSCSRSAPSRVARARNRVFFRLGVRNVAPPPRRARALIVAGLDARHGDHRRRARDRRHDEPDDPLGSPIAALGQTDEVVAAQGIEAGARGETARRPAPATSRRATPTASRGASRRTGLVDGVAPVIVEPIAVQDVASRQNEPRVTLFASDPARLRAFGADAQRRHDASSLADLGPGEVYLNAEGRREARRARRRHRARPRRAARRAARAGRGDRPLRRRRHGPAPACSCRSPPPSGCSASPG